MNTVDLALELYEIGAVKFGTFTLKSGKISPMYVDLRAIISFPALLRRIAEMLWEKAASLSYDLVCGVPYTALPLATCFSCAHDVPMILKRKEVKDYGTKKLIEGVFETGQTCLVLEDVMTTGGSILETKEALQGVGLKVDDALVIMDRQQGGRENLQEKGVRVHPLITLSELLDILYNAGKIEKNVYEVERTS